MNRVIGKGRFQRGIRRYVKDLHTGAYHALIEIGSIVKKESQARTPVDTGFLKKSQFKETRRGTLQTGTSVRIGSPMEAHYAPYVHENLEMQHRVGEAKFLENALNENMAKIKTLFEDRLRDASLASISRFRTTRLPSLTVGGITTRIFAPTIPDPRKILRDTGKVVVSRVREVGN